jgi:repressor LexA
MLPLTKRQREILDYLTEFIQQHGYAPSLEEIGRRFGLSSLATVHKHLTNLQEKGVYQARVEPQPVSRDGSDAYRRAGH